MSQWYLSKDGQALGPFEETKLIKLIQEGDVKAMDLVYSAGSTEWLPVSQVPEFSTYLSQSQEVTPADDGGAKEWVLLKKIVSETGKEYKQLGPFSQRQVIEMIDTGEIKFTDFAWKDGYESWVRITEIEVFNEPLPSSQEIDLSLYEKTTVTDAGLNLDETQGDADEKKSLTQMISIEKFDHEKTMVRPSQTDDLEKTRVKSKDDELDPFDEMEISGPINNNDFVTETKYVNDDNSSKISLWSLEPPSDKAKKSDTKNSKQKSKKTVDDTVEDEDFSESLERTRVVAPITSEIKFKDKTENRTKTSTKRKVVKERVSFIHKFSELDSETWQWVAAVGAVGLSLFFFYMSFYSDRTEVIYDRNAILSDPHIRPKKQANNLQKKIQEIREKKKEPIKFTEIESEMAAAKMAIKEAKKPLLDDPDDLTRNDIVVTNPINEDKVAAVHNGKSGKEKKSSVKISRVYHGGRGIASKKTSVKKRELSNRSKKMKNSKKRNLVIAPIKKSATSKKLSSSSSKRSTSSASSVARATGGAKAQSFYKQRDRKALFYSSIKAEALAVEIESQFKKLKGNKKAWNSYYTKWRRRVKNSLAVDIRTFPRRKEIYAYPNIIKNFKDDYSQFQKYGAVFNAKMTGGRLPSGNSKNMKVIFAKYKNQAMSLGR